MPKKRKCSAMNNSSIKTEDLENERPDIDQKEPLSMPCLLDEFDDNEEQKMNNDDIKTEDLENARPDIDQKEPLSMPCLLDEFDDNEEQKMNNDDRESSSLKDTECVRSEEDSSSNLKSPDSSRNDVSQSQNCNENVLLVTEESSSLKGTEYVRSEEDSSSNLKSPNSSRNDVSQSQNCNENAFSGCSSDFRKNKRQPKPTAKLIEYLIKEKGLKPKNNEYKTSADLNKNSFVDADFNPYVKIEAFDCLNDDKKLNVESMTSPVKNNKKRPCDSTTEIHSKRVKKPKIYFSPDSYEKTNRKKRSKSKNLDIKAESRDSSYEAAENITDNLRKFLIMGTKVANSIAVTLKHNEESIINRTSSFERKCLKLVRVMTAKSVDISDEDRDQILELLDEEHQERKFHRQTMLESMKISHLTNMALYSQMLRLLKTL